MPEDAKKPVPGRRSLLTAISGVAGLAAGGKWVKPVVKSAVLPVHATTTNPPIISRLWIDDSSAECQDANTYRGFLIRYEFTSLYGVISHIVTASCGDDTLSITDGAPAGGLGNNLLIGDTGSSFILTGNQFGGSVEISSNFLTGSDPLDCTITLTLMDENGGEAVDMVDISVNCDIGP